MSLALGTGEHFTLLAGRDVLSSGYRRTLYFVLAGRDVLSSGYWRTLYFARRTCCP